MRVLDGLGGEGAAEGEGCGGDGVVPGMARAVAGWETGLWVRG